MKKIFTLLMSAGFAGSILAQPTITNDILPVFNDHVVIGICNEPSEDYTSGGADITWDMSSLTETEEGFFDFIDPDGTYWNYLFPDATICGISHDGAYSYYKDDNDALETVGFGYILDGIDPPNDTVTSVFSDFELVLDVPFSYGITQSDSWAGDNTALGFTQAFTGTTNAEYDAYGTLVLPNGTYNNVARYHADRVQVSGFVTQTKEQWIWMSPDHRFWLMLIETIQSTGSADEIIVWYNKNPIPNSTDVSNIEQKSKLLIYPNPLSAGAPIQLNSDSREAGFLTVYDLSGKLLERMRIQLEAGQNEIDFKHDFKAGMYILEFQGEHKSMTTRMIIK